MSTFEPQVPASPRATILARNSLANLVRATSSSATNILLPVLLVVTLAPAAYASWALVWTLGTFVAYFDLGVPTTVQAIVGSHSEDGHSRSAVRAVRSGLLITSVVAALAISAAAVMGMSIGAVFPAMPIEYRWSAVLALALIVLGQASTLVSNVASSYFAGNQRSYVPAFVLTPTRYVAMAAAWIAAWISQSLFVAALAYAVPLVVGGLVLLWLFTREVRVETAPVDDVTDWGRASNYSVTGLLRHSGPLIIWSLCMLVITGAGLVIVGRLDFASVATYSIAAVVVGALAGLESASSAPFLPELARIHTKHGATEVSRLVLRFTSINSLLLFAATAAVMTFGPFLFSLLGRGARIDESLGLICLALLMLGSAIHLSGTPLSLAFIASRTHTRVVAQPVLQAIMTLLLSLVGGLSYGAAGVAAGVFLGGCLGICLTVFWSSRAAGVANDEPFHLLAVAALKPVACLIPVIACLVITAVGHVPTNGATLSLSILCLTVSLLFLVRTGLSKADRVMLRRRLLRR